MGTTAIIGGGQNGLIAAALLAQSGESVTVFEAREECGGVGASEEFAPGFFSPGVLHDTALLDPRVVQALKLEAHGLQWEGPTRRVLLTASEKPRELSPHPELSSWFDAIRPVIGSLYKNASPDLIAAINPLSLRRTGFAALKAGRSSVLEWARLMPQCAEDTLAEWVETPEDRALWMLPTLFGTYMAPLSPSSTVSLALYWSQAGKQVLGGGAGVTKALLSACEQAGVILKTNDPVTSINVEAGQAVGVTTASGIHNADRVVSTVSVADTALSLLPPGTLPASVEQRISHIRSRGNLAKIHFAVAGECPWLSGPGDDGTQYQVGAHPLDLERAFDDAKAGRIPNTPALDMRLSTSATGMAPAGHHVLSVLVYAVPTADAAVWDTPDGNETLLNRVKESISAVWPSFSEQCQSAQVLNPRDLAQDFGLPGGHLYHAELALDQLWSFRPTGDLARTRKLINGLLLAGSDTHGGGGIRGTAAFLAVK